MGEWETWKSRTRGLSLPAAFVDLDAMDRNLGVLLGQLSAGITLRLASKSIRVPAVLSYLLERGEGRVRGIMTWSAEETALLADRGFDDLLLAYPVARPEDAVLLARAASRTVTRVVVDHVDQARLLSVAAEGAGVTVRLCIEVDVALRAFDGAVHLGVRRSPIRTPEDAVALYRAVRALPGVRVDAVMAYEAQVAGLPDDSGSPRPVAMVEQWIKRRSRPHAAKQRASVVAALGEAGCEIAVVNGGGTGSVATTSSDGTVTEVAAGSGFFCPTLFDGYRGLDIRPAAFFALPVVRKPDPGHVTAFGGGYIASGPTGAGRAPVVHLPRGLRTLSMEGFGEVQTPLEVGADAPAIALGDPIVCRHAKAGELAEHFAAVHLCRGDAVVERVPTLRGLGTVFG
jgi:D-serine deaminase-like pyridoxal phosphate-dependent protein